MAIRKSKPRSPKNEASGRERPSPLQIGHVRWALLAFVGVAAIVLIAVQTLGDPGAAGPRRVVSLTGRGSAEAAPVVPFSEASMSTELPADLAAPSGDTPDRRTRADQGRARPLPRAPLAGLTERGPLGPLPIVARDGRTPGAAYAKPFLPNRRPKVALIVGGLGFNVRNTTQAIDELPSEVTLSFLPYARNLQAWINRARARGHEVMLELPMEPLDPDADDTGPQTLLSRASAAQNIQRLENLLSRGAGYFGVTNYQGGRFAASAQASGPVVRQITRRGLVFLASGIGPRTPFAFEAARAGLPIAIADRVIDARNEADAIGEQLVALESIAIQRGAAIGAGFAYPVTMEQIAVWAGEVRARGIVLAPVSAVIRVRTQR